MRLNTEEKRKAIINVMFIVMILAIAYVILKYALPLISPFVIGFIVAAILHKPAAALAKKIRIPQSAVGIIFTIVFYALIGTLGVMLVAKLVDLVVSLFSDLPQIYENYILPFLDDLYDTLGTKFNLIDNSAVDDLMENSMELFESLSGAISEVSVVAIKSATNFATSLPNMMVQVLFTIISSFFFVIDFDKITHFLKMQLPEKGQALVTTAGQFISGSILVYIKSYSLILGITFCELFAGLCILRVPNASIIAFAIAIMDILPVVGTGLAVIPWAIINLLYGNLFLGIGLLVLYVIITAIRNVIEPRIVGQQIGLHPCATLFLMFCGLKIASFLGMFLFPVTASLLLYLSETGELKVFNLDSDDDAENGEDGEKKKIALQKLGAAKNKIFDKVKKKKK